MKKNIGAIFLVAGTCVGSGMIALPMVLSQLGLIPTILLMLFVWFIMYYTSLVSLELNLQAGRGLSLGALGRHFSGKFAELVGVICLKLLSYSLLAVYIYGGSSILQELIAKKTEEIYSLDAILVIYAAAAIGLLLLPIKLIDYVNRILFIGLIIVGAILMAGLMLSVDWHNLPLFSEKYQEISVWAALMPIIFTSFGFQVIFHTLTEYCHKDAKALKQAFFWGSLIPAIVYIIWTCSVLSVVYHDNPIFYSQMIAGEVEVGELIQELSGIAKWNLVQLLVWWISILAIATSMLGVGVGLCDSLKRMLSKKVPNVTLRNILAPLIAVLPSYFMVIYIPNAFISALGFAGMILAIIAILLPVYLLGKITSDQYYYPELRARWLIWLSIAMAITVILSELYSLDFSLIRLVN